MIALRRGSSRHRLHFVPAIVFPYKTLTGLTYDSGDYIANLNTALALADYDTLPL